MSEFKVAPHIRQGITRAVDTGVDAGAVKKTAETTAVTATTTTPTTTTTTQTPVAALFPEAKKEATTKKPGTLKPHEALMSAVNKPKHANFAAAFTSVIGKGAVDELKAAISNKPIVLIAGDQCTGKGTAAEGLVKDLGGANTGTGTVLRALAKENGLTIEQMSALLSGKSATLEGTDGKPGRTVTLADFPHLGDASDVDVKLDFRATRAIASSQLQKADGTTLDVSVFESRLAGHLGQFLEGLGRENIVSVYLYAAPRVQAERYLEREIWAPAEAKATTDAERKNIADAKAAGRVILQGLDDSVPLEAALQKLADGLKDKGVAGLDALAGKVAGIAGRDSNDKTRLLSLYGVNYQDRSAFDVVVDTNGKTPAQVKQAIVDAVAAKTASTAAQQS